MNNKQKKKFSQMFGILSKKKKKRKKVIFIFLFDLFQVVDDRDYFYF